MCHISEFKDFQASLYVSYHHGGITSTEDHQWTSRPTSPNILSGTIAPHFLLRLITSSANVCIILSFAFNCFLSFWSSSCNSLVAPSTAARMLPFVLGDAGRDRGSGYPAISGFLIGGCLGGENCSGLLFSLCLNCPNSSLFLLFNKFLLCVLYEPIFLKVNQIFQQDRGL